ncbi:MAG: transporter substrate-binding domain-containing protein [Ahrensia sp.]|nr:transporter substrate-binding domain-containing protein [Ahrensia sp.]
MKMRLTIAKTLLALVAAVLAGALAPASLAQTGAGPVIPDFFDPQDRLIRPSLKDRPRLRFLTVTDFPPFSFIDQQNRLVGFHVELAREICRELELQAQCQIQALPFGELEAALNSGEGEAIMAGIPIDAQSRARFSFTLSYFHIPGRFVAANDLAATGPLAKLLADKAVGIVHGTAHAAFAQATFGDIRLRLFEDQASALAALEKQSVAAVFSDALSLAFWLQGKQGSACCGFLGEAFPAHTYFGRGLAIAVKRDDLELTEGLNFALRSINAKGKFAELYLRYFPIGLY